MEVITNRVPRIPGIINVKQDVNDAPLILWTRVLHSSLPEENKEGKVLSQPFIIFDQPLIGFLGLDGVYHKEIT